MDVFEKKTIYRPILKKKNMDIWKKIIWTYLKKKLYIDLFWKKNFIDIFEKNYI